MRARWSRGRGLAAVLLAAGLVSARPGAWPTAAAEGSPPLYPPTPILRIEAGMHTAAVNRVTADVRGQYLVTASGDKTARVWDLRTGKLLRILRPPIGNTDEGSLYAVAISPDGSTIAVSGWTGPIGHMCIYLFDRASGRLVRRIGDLPEVVLNLALSRDGAYLAAGLGGANGVRVFRLEDGAEVMSDRRYRDASNGVEFDRGGRLASASDDGEIRLYGPGPTFPLLKSRAPPEGRKPFSVAFSPGGDRLAVAFYDSTRVLVLSARDLGALYEPDTTGIDSGTLSSTAWSEDGARLVAGGRYHTSGSHPIAMWGDSGRGRRMLLPAAANTILDVRALANHRFVVGSAEPSWSVLDDSGRRLVSAPSPIQDLRYNDHRLALSADGGIVDFDSGLEKGQRRMLRFDLRRRSLEERPAGAAGTTTPISEGLGVSSWMNSNEVAHDGRRLTLAANEISRSLAGIPGGGFILGTEWYLRRFDARGTPGRVTSIPAIAWGVNVSRDGRLAVAALGDGTIRWYGLADGRERLVLFLHRDGRWVAWTPEGFYDASPGGEALIGYHLNQGSDREAKFVGVEQMAARFFRPDVVAARLFDERVASVALQQGGDVAATMRRGLPPEVQILDVTALDDGSVRVRVRVRDGGGGLGKLSFSVDGHLIEARGVGVVVPGESEYTLPVAPGERVVSVTASTRNGELSSQPDARKVQARAPALEVRPTLHVLTVGVDRYVDLGIPKVKFAEPDTRDLGQALGQGARGLFGNTELVSLFGSQVTLPRLRATFEALSRRVKPTDAFVLYLAGHGTALDGEYYFYPQDLVVKGAGDLRKSALSGSHLLRDLMAKIPATKRLILLDTCSAGTLLASRGDAKPALIKLNQSSGEHILAATNEDALEFKGHGAFTAAVLEALTTGAADLDRSGYLDILELAKYVDKRVPEMTAAAMGYRQQPLMLLGKQPFPLASVPAPR